MHAATYDAFLDELSFIYDLEKDAGLKDVLKKGTSQVKKVVDGADRLSTKAGVFGMSRADDALSALHRSAAKHLPKPAAKLVNALPKSSFELMEQVPKTLPTRVYPG
jgi:hypothetical protein